jgi:type I restriction enzyme, S subunit
MFNLRTGSKQGLGLEDVRTVWIAVPPMDDQIKISQFLDKKVKVIKKTIASLKSSISLLREYRAALITAAVTGQIDVRGVAAAEEAA